MALITALDLLAQEGSLAFPLIEEQAQLNPELGIFGAETIPGTSISLSVRSSLPTVGFRNLNEGTTRTKSGYTERTFETHILDAQIGVDTRGLTGRNRGQVLENEAAGFVEAAQRTIGAQTYYGTGNDSKGFPGLIAQSSNASTHTVDATGSSAKTSVWFLRIGRETVQYIFGEDTTINLNPEWAVETLYDSNSKPYQALTNWLTGRVGLRLANRNAALRIKNIGTATDKTLTVAHMREGLRKFREFGAEPTHILMTGRSQEQLTEDVQSNTSSPDLLNMVSSFENIPFTITSNISNAETI